MQVCVCLFPACLPPQYNRICRSACIMLLYCLTQPIGRNIFFCSIGTQRRHTHTHTHMQCTHTHMQRAHTHMHTDRETDRQTHSHTHTHTHTERKTERHTHTHTHSLPKCFPANTGVISKGFSLCTEGLFSLSWFHLPLGSS